MSARDMVNFERAVRLCDVLAAYTKPDDRSNVIELLADSMHWCEIEGHRFEEVLEVARHHFDATATEEKEVTNRLIDARI